MSSQLADWVRARRQALGMPRQSDLAHRMGPGVDPNYVAQLETGRVKVPNQPYLSRLATALGTTQTEILRICGLIVEEPGDNGATVDAEEWRLRTLVRELGTEERALLLDIGDVLRRRTGGDQAASGRE